MNPPTQRPTGVTVLGTVNLVATAPLLAYGATLGVSAVWNIREMVQEGGNSGFMIAKAVFGILSGLAFFASGVAVAWAGRGLLRLRNWARVLTLGVAILMLSFFATLLLVSLFEFDPLRWAAGLTVIAGNGWVLWYLNQPDVRQTFSAKSGVPKGSEPA